MVKIKTKRNNNELVVEFYNKKELLDKTVKYVNTCMVCHKESVDNANFGDRHICKDCMSILKREVVAPKKVVVKDPVSVIDKIKRYEPTVEVVDIINYKNLITGGTINEKVMNTIVDLVLKGINTPEKVANTIGHDNVLTIRKYMNSMARVGMLYRTGTKRIYKVHPKLVYTAVV